MTLTGLEAIRAERLRALGVRESAIRDSAATRPMSLRKSASHIRVFQWNVLADGLADDGFLVADVLENWPVGEGMLPDTGGSAAKLGELARELASVNGLAPEQRDRKLRNLVARFNTPVARANLASVVDWRARAARIQAEIVAADPDLIALQELDHFEEFARNLEKHGYECGMPGALERYTPVHRANIPVGNADAYLRHLLAAGVAFAPSLPSTARKIALKSGNAGADCAGVALFWKRDAFKLTRLEYLTYIGAKERMGGKSKGALKAVLTCSKAGGEEFHFMTAHFASGSTVEGEQARVNGDLLGIAHVLASDMTPPTACTGIREWLATSAAKAPTVLALDANATPEIRSIIGRTEPTVWSVLHGLDGVASVWDWWYRRSGARRAGVSLPVPVSKNKLRGPLSGQQRKIGLHAHCLIDHIYFSSSRLKLDAHVRPPLRHHSAEAALGSLLPTLANPSDHVPVIVDFVMAKQEVQPEECVLKRKLVERKFPAKRARMVDVSIAEVAPMGA
mmetsp:Transcript_54921/g.163518  ORF Transcript_54921/g.163518 Transcript_54921/m.163518 type:complete len:510 (+) Transcript_54921:81-1610(+)